MSCFRTLLCGRGYHRKSQVDNAIDSPDEQVILPRRGTTLEENGNPKLKISRKAVDEHGLDLSSVTSFYVPNNPTQPTDLHIQVNSCLFQVHKDVLCNKSEYFKAMFDCGLQETVSSEEKPTTIQMKGDTPTAHALQTLLHFMYFGKLEFRKSKLEEIIPAANFLLVSSVWQEFEKIIDLENWSIFLELAEIYNITELKETTYEYIRCNYSVLQCVLSFQKRKRHNRNLSLEYLSKVSNLNGRGRFTREVIAVAGCYKDKHTSPAQRQGNIIYFYDSRTKSWKLLDTLPPSLRGSHVCVDVTAWDDTIYAVGGKNRPFDKDTSEFLRDLQDVGSAYKLFTYNTILGEWTRLRPVHGKALGKTHLIATETKKLYILQDGYQGGYEYDLTNNSWSSLEVETRMMRDCCYGNNVIYMFCRDWSLSRYTYHLARYNTESGKYEENFASEQVLPSGRCTHICFLDDVIYIIDNTIPFDCFLFRFDPQTNTRNLLSSAPIRDFGFKEGCEALGFQGRVYYLGEHKVACFDVKDLSWTCLPEFPANFEPKSMFTVTIPRDLAKIAISLA
ncbi:uncharacterized protein LOC144444807 [Glandiceps talaboti]